MSTEQKQTQYCGSGQSLGETILVDLNINQLREILANPDNQQFKKHFTTKTGQENEVIKLKLVKRKELQGYSTHFLALNDYVRNGEEKEQAKNDLPF